MPYKIETKKELRKLVNDFCSTGGDSPAIIGISGPVGSGKSFISSLVRSEIAEKKECELNYIPFDYWINYKNRQASVYAERFLLDDFISALQKIKKGEAWLKPRYDLVSLIKKKKDGIVLEEQSGNRKIRRIRNFGEIFLGEKGEAYMEPDSFQIYTLERPFRGFCLLDGTMIFAPKGLKNEYGLKIYVKAPWANRLARMAGRYRRGEVFTKEFDSEKEYVFFLAREARSCADKEIENQLDESTYVMENRGDSLSDLSDLYFLKKELEENPGLEKEYSVSAREVDSAIKDIYDYFSGSPDEEDVLRLKKELAGKSSEEADKLKSIIRRFC